METLTLLTGGFLLKIEFTHSEVPQISNSFKRQVKNHFRSFKVDSSQHRKIDFIIHVHDASHTVYSQRKNLEEGREFISLFLERKKGRIITNYHLSLSQFIHLVSFVVIQLLQDHKGFMLHGSASNIFGKAHVYTGISGAGKSTAVLLLERKFPRLEDDRVIIKEEKDEYMFYHTPMVVKTGTLRRNYKGYPLAAVYFLSKTPYFKMNTLSKKDEILRLLLSQVVADADTYKKSIENLHRFVSKFNGFYSLSFRKDARGMVSLFSRVSS